MTTARSINQQIKDAERNGRNVYIIADTPIRIIRAKGKAGSVLVQPLYNCTAWLAIDADTTIEER